MADFELRDPIHHRIAFSEFERQLIDHPFFQRLRFVSQLGFLQAYVYPGAVHDRFSHGIGAMHVAGRLFSRMIQSSMLLNELLTKEEMESLRLRVRVAGLLHDLGHGPFSHASESVFPLLQTLPLQWSWWHSRPARQAVHEDYSVLLIQTISGEGMLNTSFAQDICSLIHKDVQPSPFLVELEQKISGLNRVLKGLISGEADGDRMDYLLRDSYFCGVAYGQYDLDWLISAMGVAKKQDELIVTISENGVRAYEDMLLARYHMIDQVYYHKTKAGFEHYLRQAIENHEIPLIIPSDPYAYAQLRDGAVIEQMFEAAKDLKNYWSVHLVKRLPAKRILRLHTNRSEDAVLLGRLKDFCQQHEIGFFMHEVKNQFSHFNEEDSDQATMTYVAKKSVNSMEYVPISKYSDLLQKYNEKLNFTDFFVRREDTKRFESLKESF